VSEKSAVCRCFEDVQSDFL